MASCAACSKWTVLIHARWACVHACIGTGGRRPRRSKNLPNRCRARRLILFGGLPRAGPDAQRFVRRMAGTTRPSSRRRDNSAQASSRHDGPSSHDRRLLRAPASVPRPRTSLQRRQLPIHHESRGAGLVTHPQLLRRPELLHQLANRLWPVGDHAQGAHLTSRCRRCDRNRFRMNIETDMVRCSWPALRMWLCDVDSNSRSVTHELRIGAGCSIVTNARAGLWTRAHLTGGQLSSRHNDKGGVEGRGKASRWVNLAACTRP